MGPPMIGLAMHVDGIYVRCEVTGLPCNRQQRARPKLRNPWQLYYPVRGEPARVIPKYKGEGYRQPFPALESFYFFSLYRSTILPSHDTSVLSYLIISKKRRVFELLKNPVDLFRYRLS